MASTIRSDIGKINLFLEPRQCLMDVGGSQNHDKLPLLTGHAVHLDDVALHPPACLMCTLTPPLAGRRVVPGYAEKEPHQLHTLPAVLAGQCAAALVEECCPTRGGYSLSQASYCNSPWRSHHQDPSPWGLQEVGQNIGKTTASSSNLLASVKSAMSSQRTLGS